MIADACSCGGLSEGRLDLDDSVDVIAVADHCGYETWEGGVAWLDKYCIGMSVPLTEFFP